MATTAHTAMLQKLSFNVPKTMNVAKRLLFKEIRIYHTQQVNYGLQMSGDISLLCFI